MTNSAHKTECLIAMGSTLVLTVLSVVGMMVVFLGAGGPDSDGLRVILLAGSALALVWALLAGFRGMATRWWQRLPTWLWVAGLTMWTLAILALIALIMIERISGVATPTGDYLPIAAALVGSLVFAIAQAHVAPQRATRFSAALPDSVDD